MAGGEGACTNRAEQKQNAACRPAPDPNSKRTSNTTALVAALDNLTSGRCTRERALQLLQLVAKQPGTDVNMARVQQPRPAVCSAQRALLTTKANPGSQRPTLSLR